MNNHEETKTEDEGITLEVDKSQQKCRVQDKAIGQDEGR